MSWFVVTSETQTASGPATRTFRCATRAQAERWRDELNDYSCVNHVTIEETT